MKTHDYRVSVTWTGNKGSGTSHYTAYSRDHEISVKGKPPLPASSDTIFRGDASRYNPEDMLVASLSACHMLWYLHLCADSGVVVKEYADNATGVLCLPSTEPGYFSEVVLHPKVLVSDPSMIEKAIALHHQAHEKCFIANSCNFPVNHIPTCTAES